MAVFKKSIKIGGGKLAKITSGLVGYNSCMATFSREEIQYGLKRLGELAQASGFQIHLTLVGGAVMVLAIRRANLRGMWTRLSFFQKKRGLSACRQSRLLKNASGPMIG